MDEQLRLNILKGANLIAIKGGGYSFRYPYAFFFFLGKYLADRIGEQEIRLKIAEYCNQLRLTDNANAILFLAHHSRDKFVYESVATVLKAQFVGIEPISFENNMPLLKGLIEESPKLIFKGGDAKENRRLIREMQDRDGGERDLSQLDEQAKTGGDEALALSSSLNTLMKTIEILGLILKNHYGSILNSAKQELLRELFDGSYRALHRIFEILLKEPEFLLNEIETLIQHHQKELDIDECRAMAKKVTFQLMGMISFAFIRKTASSVGSEYLRESISTIVKAENSLGYRLIWMATELDRAGEVPLLEIKRLNGDTITNPFAKSLLQSLVLRYLYMFPTRDSEKQALCSELDISMDYQRGIDIQSAKSKKARRIGSR